MVWRAVRHLQSTPHKGSRLSRGIALQTKSGDAETAAASKSQPDGGDADGGVVVPSAVMRVQWVVPNVDAFSTSMDCLAAQPTCVMAERSRSLLGKKKTMKAAVLSRSVATAVL